MILVINVIIDGNKYMDNLLIINQSISTPTFAKNGTHRENLVQILYLFDSHEVSTGGAI